MTTHKYIDRRTKAPVSEPVAGDCFLRILYGPVATWLPPLLSFFASRPMSRFIAWIAFYAPWIRGDAAGFARANGIRLDDILGKPEELRTRKDVFLRKIDFERHRPMTDDQRAVVSPADAKTLCGSLDGVAALPIKGRFFDLAELLGRREPWTKVFAGGDFVISRLAPPDYHWFHSPVSGRVVDVFLLDGRYYSVNPLAIRAVTGVLSKNARQIVVIDTDVDGGTAVGRVAVIPVAAQVIGGIVLSYCDSGYDNPTALRAGLFVKRGQPLGWFEPGGSTVLTLFEKNKIEFAPDLLELQARDDVPSLYDAQIFGRTMSEVAVKVRDAFATAMKTTGP